MGVDGLIIAVEVDSAAGLPAFDIVGLPDTAVRESKERVRTAIRNSGIQLRQEKVTINLAPAGIRKDSPGLDLPIAVGLLAAYGVVPADCLQTSFFAAELSLEGECRPVRGILPMVIAAREKGLTSVFVARGNANEALLVEGVTVYVIDCLHEVVQFCNGQESLTPAVPSMEEAAPVLRDDFADVQGHQACGCHKIPPLTKKRPAEADRCNTILFLQIHSHQDCRSHRAEFPDACAQTAYRIAPGRAP